MGREKTVPAALLVILGRHPPFSTVGRQIDGLAQGRTAERAPEGDADGGRVSHWVGREYSIV